MMKGAELWRKIFIHVPYELHYHVYHAVMCLNSYTKKGYNPMIKRI